MKYYLLLLLLLLLLLAMASAFFLTSCVDDDDDATTPSPTKTELITNKNWVMIAETMTMNGVTTDTYVTKNACKKDNILTFHTNMTATQDEGATKCDPSAPQSTSSNWSFTNNETKIKFGLNGGNEFDMIELTANKFVFSFTNQRNSNGTLSDITMTNTFTAQ